MILNLNESNENYIVIGNGEDVCLFCANELAKKDHISLSSADRKLRGKYYGKKMVKPPMNGIRLTICLEHIHKIAKLYPLTEEEPAEEES